MISRFVMEFLSEFPSRAAIILTEGRLAYVRKRETRNEKYSII